MRRSSTRRGSRRHQDLQVIVPKAVDIHAVFINANKPQWKDPNIMKAIYHAVDRRTINDTILNGTGRVLNNPPGFSQDYPDVDQYAYDPEKAKQLLTEANFPSISRSSFPISQPKPSGRGCFQWSRHTCRRSGSRPS